MRELYKRNRPKTFEDVVGQDVKSLQTKVAKGKIPHALLFTGPSGCGKTTLARITARQVGCGKYDLSEVNCADFRGIDTIRDIRGRMNQAPMSGESKVWIIDEAHKLSGDAQNAFLKMLEDTPQHVYFMLATTDSQKLLKTIRTRCMEVVVKSLSDRDMRGLIKKVCEKETITITPAVVDKIVENCEGSARKALVLLDQIMDIEKESDRLDSISSSIVEKQAIVIARSLLNPKMKWAEMAKILKETDIEEPEQIRWMVLGYMKSVLLGNSPLAARAFVVIDTFKDHFYDSKTAGLVHACYAVLAGA